jgi:hypothetical protein
VTDEARVLDRGVGGISRRATSWLAWSLGLLSVALLSASAVLLVLNRPTRVVEGPGVWGTANVPFFVLTTALGFTLVGALVASRRPTNPIGWISLAAGLALALFNAAGEYFAATGVASFVVGVLLAPSAPGLALKVAQDVTIITFAGPPIAAGIAILRYRLYDIDVLINRTLVYGSLTLLLALVYFGSVAATEAIFRTLTGQEQQPQLATVISTLVIAALFNPLRRRIQSFIDRRFYRSKYDAKEILETFSAKLRDETDLDALREDLVGVVRETMRPAHISLWLPPDPAVQGKKKKAAIRETGHDE